MSSISSSPSCPAALSSVRTLTVATKIFCEVNNSARGLLTRQPAKVHKTTAAANKANAATTVIRHARRSSPLFRGAGYLLGFIFDSLRSIEY